MDSVIFTYKDRVVARIENPDAYNADGTPNIQKFSQKFGTQDKDWKFVKESYPKGDYFNNGEKWVEYEKEWRIVPLQLFRKKYLYEKYWYDGKKWVECGVINKKVLKTNHLEIIPLDGDYKSLEIGINGENAYRVKYIRWVEKNRQTGDVICEKDYPIENNFFYNTGVQQQMVFLKGHKNSILQKDAQFKIISKKDFLENGQLKNNLSYDNSIILFMPNAQKIKQPNKNNISIFNSIFTYNFNFTDQNIDTQHICCEKMDIQHSVFLSYVNVFQINIGDTLNLENNFFEKGALLAKIKLKYNIICCDNYLGASIGITNCNIKYINCDNNISPEGIIIANCNIEKGISVKHTHLEYFTLCFVKTRFLNLNFANINNIRFDINREYLNSLNEEKYKTSVKEMDVLSCKISVKDMPLKAVVEKVTADCLEDRALTISSIGSIYADEIKCEYFRLSVMQVDLISLSGSDIDTFHIGFVPNIKYIRTYQTTINKADSYQSFTILKNIFINNHDRVQALEYCVKEADTHLQELLQKKQWGKLDKILILWFNKITSVHGTQAFRPLIFLYFLHVLSAVWLYFGTSEINNYMFFTDLYRSIIDTIPFYKMESLDMKKEPLDVSFGLKWAIFIKNIIHYILLYEIIQSFRQFNRRF